jgi:hypothetical protein
MGLPRVECSSKAKVWRHIAGTSGTGRPYASFELELPESGIQCSGHDRAEAPKRPNEIRPAR